MTRYKNFGGLIMNMKVAKEIKNCYCFRVYHFLYEYTNENNYVCTSYNTIADETNMSLRKAKDCVKWLVENGYIYKIRVNSKLQNLNNIYLVDEIIKNKKIELNEVIQLEYNEEHRKLKQILEESKIIIKQ